MSSYVRYYGRLARQSAYSVAKGVALPFVRNEAVRSGSHEMAYPISTYAPWQTDEEFQRVYDAVRRNTLVDIWRCYELWSLVGELREVPGSILEVGVWRGGTGCLMADASRGARDRRSGVPVRHVGGGGQDRGGRHVLPRREARRRVA